MVRGLSLRAAPEDRRRSFGVCVIAVTIHHHVPTFHTEHCVYAYLLSSGHDYQTCGRPCELDVTRGTMRTLTVLR